MFFAVFLSGQMPTFCAGVTRASPKTATDASDSPPTHYLHRSFLLLVPTHFEAQFGRFVDENLRERLEFPREMVSPVDLARPAHSTNSWIPGHDS